MPRLRGAQVLAYVPVTVNNFKYGFKTNERKFNGYGSALGQKTALGVTGVFYGANSPKPGIARKLFKEGSTSGYFDLAKRASLQKAGWTLNNGDASQGIRTDGLSVTVAHDTPYGYMYAWNVTKAEAAVAKQLGAVVPTDPDKLVWGSFPKPPVAKRRDASGSKSTFCKPDLAQINQAILAGWSVESPDPDWGL